MHERLQTALKRPATAHALFILLTLILFRDFFARGFVLAGNIDRTDDIMPYLMLGRKALSAGVIPQWNPFSFCGTSALGNSLLPFFDPLHWPLWMVNGSALPLVLTVFAMMHLYLRLVFAYLFFKTRFRDSAWAFPAALAYGLSTTSVYNIMNGLDASVSFTLFPLLLYAVATHNRRSWAANATFQAILLSLLWLGGHLQFTLYFTGFYVLFVLEHILVPGRASAPDGATPRSGAKERGVSSLSLGERVGVRGLLTAAGAACLMAVLIASVRILPVRAWSAMEEFYRGTQTTWQALQRHACSPLEITRLFAPQFFGVQLHSGLFRRDEPIQYIGSLNHDEAFNCYAGIGCLVLAVYAMVFVWNRRIALAKIVPLAVMLIATGTPAAWLHYVVTGSASLFLPDTVCLLPVCLGLLMGYAGESLESERSGRPRMILVVAGVALAAFVPLGLFYARVREPAPAVNVTLMRVSLGYAAAVLVLAVPMLTRLGPFRRPGLMQCGFIALLTLDLLLMADVEANGLERPFLVSRPLYAKDAITNGLAASFRAERGMYRCCDYRYVPNNALRSRGLGSNYGNRGLVFGYYDSGGYDSLPPGYMAQLLRYPNVTNERTELRNLFATRDRALRLTGSRYVALPAGIQSLTDCLPRVALFTRFHVEPDSARAMQRLFAKDFDYRSELVLAREPPIAPAGGAVNGKPVIEAEGLNFVDVRVRTAADCLLLVNDTYDHGWRATVDGNPAGIIRANLAFRAIAVPAGWHLVRLRYTHPGLRTGAWLSLLGLALLGGVAVLCVRRKGGAEAK